MHAIRRVQVTFAVSLLLLNVTAAPLRAADLKTQPGYVSAELIYEEAPFPACHASTIVETSDGLLAAWFGGTDEREPDVGIWTSRLKEGQWSPPVEVANGVESAEVRYPTWNPVLFQPKAGPLMLFYKVGPNPDRWWGMKMTSTDGGHTWSKPERLPDGILGPIKNKPVQLASGDILSPTSSEHDGWRVYFERSTDGGKTWTATKPVNDGYKLAAIQPSVLFHKDGRLQAVGRTMNDVVFQTWSDNDGQTWSEMTSTGLPNPDAGTDAVTLADGRQLLVYNHNSVRDDAGRTPLNIAVSDDGENWESALVLEDDPTRHFSYPAVIQTADGLVHVTYTWNRERIKHVVVDPAKFKTSPITDKTPLSKTK
jgi:predicted neuraminidase